jgi:hypothetical protein
LPFLPRLPREIPIMICACGCGSILTPRPYPVRFIKGHRPNRRCNHWAQKDAVKERTSHERANKLLFGVSRCELDFIGECKGKLHVAHVDGNPQNNALGNLLKLCNTHHRLLDNGKIDLNDPRMPEFYVSNGQPKRRYIYRKPKYKHLTPSMVRSIRTDSRSQREIAESHGISQSSVSNARSRKTWKHMTNRNVQKEQQEAECTTTA